MLPVLSHKKSIATISQKSILFCALVGPKFTHIIADYNLYNWRAKRACMFMSFEIRDTYIYMPKILKWLRKTRGTQYASIHETCVHIRMRWSISNKPIYEVKNSCFRVNWNCRLPFKEDSLREGEWVCHENIIKL